MSVAVPYMGLAEAPTTYQDWMDCFSYVKSHPADYISLRLLRKGKLFCNSYILDKFLQRMDDTVRKILNHCISSFLSRVNEAFEENDFDSVEILAIRFWESAAECFFFEELDCIPERQTREFHEGYVEQLNKFWKYFLSELEQESEKYCNLELDDLVFRLKRLNYERIKKGMQR